jgi:LuxR family transcriptional regulator, maltose regulon positive regulatory protein
MVLVPRVKITVPTLPSEFVVRPELCAELETAASADVALICAPAGYGKTLLLADWSRTSTTADTAWVGLDRDDNDPRRLWSAVLSAIAGCASVPPSSRLHAAWAWRPDAMTQTIVEFAEALQGLPQPVRLILDDVHELIEPEVLAGLQTFIRVKPATVRLVLASRLDPPLSLPRLRLTGRLRELRAAQLSLTPPQTAALLERSGLCLSPSQVELLHTRTGGWAAGVRMAALGMGESEDREAFLAQFSGDDRSVADYLVGEILSGLSADVQEFLRVISISDPVPTGLAVALSGRDDAGGLLDQLEHRTSLVNATGRRRETYRIQELLRAYLRADLRRKGTGQLAGLHTVAARWWAGQNQPVRALDHAAQSHDDALLTDLLHQFAVALILAGDHGPLRQALATIGAPATATDPWLCLTSALTHLEAGETSAARADLRHARKLWPSDGPVDLAVLRAVAEQFGAGATSPAPLAVADADDLPAAPGLEALTHLSQGNARLLCDDRTGARAEFDAALVLSRRHGFDYLTMQCLALLGVVAGAAGDMRSMRAVSREALTTAGDHGWEGTSWSITATAMLAYSDLQRAQAADAQRLTAHGLGSDLSASTAPVRFVLQSVHGAAVFDAGDQVSGLTELQQARADFGDSEATPQICAAMAGLEFRAALLLGHAAAAQTTLGWLTERTGESGDRLVMRAWAENAAGRHDHARALIRPVLDGSALILHPHAVVDAWLLETSLALVADERPIARHAVQTALGIAELLDALRPFAHAEPGVRELLAHQHGSFGASDAFVDRALAVRAGRVRQQALLSQRETTVLTMLPSLLSLDEIAEDLTVSVNTVKSHVRSIYTKLGVSSRRLAVLVAHEHGLLHTSVR